MQEQRYSYIIVGAGLSGVSAAEGIRQLDPRGSVLLLGAEADLPYDRPPLSKQLWAGTKAVPEVVLHEGDFYQKLAVDLRRGVEVTQLDPSAHEVRDSSGTVYRYERLLLATGGSPRRLEIPGGDLDGISYYRTLADFRALRGAAAAGKSALVIGGGFIGSEMAAALRMNGLAVTMVFPSPWLVSRVFPESLGRHLTDHYRGKGVVVLAGDVPVSIRRQGGSYLTLTRGGREIRSDLVVAGVGIRPNVALARAAGLTTATGVCVDEFLQTSHPDIYAAGDLAFAPHPILGPRRVQHWDNAAAQGKHAGRNMAGAGEPFTYIPFFFSDLFEFGYEAVGDIDSRLRTFADWQEENKTGVIYYLGDGGRVRGVMLCDVWGRVDAARALIEKATPVTEHELRGAIRPEPALAAT
jgi:3-phenylpropionate/trans-cinnamate dioxygenase ferredoxin reductase component